MVLASCLCGVLITLQALGQTGAIATPSKRAQCAATIATATVNQYYSVADAVTLNCVFLLERHEPSAIAVL